jgi:hypothetical protein
MKSSAEPVQERELCPITDRIPRGIGSDRKVEADDGTPGSGVGQVEVRELTVLEPMDLLVSRCARATDIAQTQAARPTGGPEVARQPLQ